MYIYSDLRNKENLDEESYSNELNYRKINIFNDNELDKSIHQLKNSLQRKNEFIDKYNKVIKINNEHLKKYSDFIKNKGIISNPNFGDKNNFNNEKGKHKRDISSLNNVNYSFLSNNCNKEKDPYFFFDPGSYKNLTKLEKPNNTKLKSIIKEKSFDNIFESIKKLHELEENIDKIYSIDRIPNIDNTNLKKIFFRKIQSKRRGADIRNGKLKNLNIRKYKNSLIPSSLENSFNRTAKSESFISSVKKDELSNSIGNINISNIQSELNKEKEIEIKGRSSDFLNKLNDIKFNSILENLNQFTRINNVHEKGDGLNILKEETEEILKLDTPREIKSILMKIFDLKKNDDLKFKELIHKNPEFLNEMFVQLYDISSEDKEIFKYYVSQNKESIVKIKDKIHFLKNVVDYLYARVFKNKLDSKKQELINHKALSEFRLKNNRYVIKNELIHQQYLNKSKIKNSKIINSTDIFSISNERDFLLKAEKPKKLSSLIIDNTQKKSRLLKINKFYQNNHQVSILDKNSKVSESELILYPKDLNPNADKDPPDRFKEVPRTNSIIKPKIDSSKLRLEINKPRRRRNYKSMEYLNDYEISKIHSLSNNQTSTLNHNSIHNDSLIININNNLSKFEKKDKSEIKKDIFDNELIIKTPPIFDKRKCSLNKIKYSNINSINKDSFNNGKDSIIIGNRDNNLIGDINKTDKKFMFTKNAFEDYKKKKEVKAFKIIAPLIVNSIPCYEL